MRSPLGPPLPLGAASAVRASYSGEAFCFLFSSQNLLLFYPTAVVLVQTEPRRASGRRGEAPLAIHLIIQVYGVCEFDVRCSS